MDYSKIVLKGYFDENSREFLVDYFNRKSKKAKKRGINSDEFFGGCLKAIEIFKNDLDRQLYKRKIELETSIKRAKNKTAKFNSSDQPGLSYEEKCKYLIKTFTAELKEISKDNFNVHLDRITKGEFVGQLSNYDLNQINKSLFLAQKKIELKKMKTDLNQIIIKSKDIKRKKNLTDFINNIKDKINFLDELKKIFPTEKGIQLKIMLELLKEENIILIGSREFKTFYNCLKDFLNRDIGTYTALNDLYNHKDSQIEYYKDDIQTISEKLNPLITKYKSA